MHGRGYPLSKNIEVGDPFADTMYEGNFPGFFNFITASDKQ